MTGTPALRPASPTRTSSLPARLGVLVAAAMLLATCAGPGPTRVPGAGETPFPSGPARATPASSGSPVSSAAPGTSPELVWTGVTSSLGEPIATLEPTRTVPAGVPLDAGFRLASLQGEDAMALAGRIAADPAVTFTVARGDDGAAILTPAAPLRTATLYRITLTGDDGTVRAVWPVETVRNLWISHSIPDEESDAVPVDSGIEITFNVDGVRLEDVEPYLTLEPAVPGHLEQSGRSVALVPDGPLTPATRYHLRVRAGLPLAGTSQVLDEDYEVWFSTRGFTEPDLRVGFRRTLVEAGTTTRPIFPVFVSRDDEDEEPAVDIPSRLDVTVHRLPGIAEAIAGWRTLGEYWWDTSSIAPTIPTAGLPLVVDAKVRLRDFGPTQEDYDDSRWFRLPSTLPAGWYVATVDLPGSVSQAVLQVTDVAVYAQTTIGTSVVWANDVATGGPLAGASVQLDATTLGATDSRGLLETRIDLPEGETPKSEFPVVIVRDGDRAAFVAAGDPECGKCGYGGGGRWWRLFTLDRSRYRTTDTVTGWGVVRARGDRSVPAEATVRLTTGDEEDGEEIALAVTTVKPDARGAFMVTLPIEDAPAGYYTVEVATGDETIASQSFHVGEIIKPAWSVEVSLRRHAVISGSRVGVDVHAAFFEGTPVAGTAIKVGQRRPFTRVATDLAGDASTRVAILARRSESDGTAWWTTEVRATPVDPEEAQIGGSAGIAVFSSSVLPTVEAVATASRLTVSGRVHDVAFERFEDPPAGGLGAVDPYGDPRKGIRLDVRVRQHLYTTSRVGSTYDFISKQTIPVYRTRERIVELGTRSVRSNAQGRFRLQLPVRGPSDGFEVIVTAYDPKGRAVKVETWGDAPATLDIPELGARLEGPGTWEFPVEISVGEKARVDYVGGAGATRRSRYLWTVSQSGLQDLVLTTKPAVSLAFRKDWIPAAHVHAVRFTGSGYEVPDNSVVLPFATGDRRLTVSMTSDKTRYRPGDTATVSILVMDPDGRPVKASVYVRAVDEKLFAIGAADVADPVEQLYMDEGSGVTGVGWTHHDPRPFGDGGFGDATGGGEERSDFRDWLVNTLLVTGADGRASTSFRVSDDLTSWRIVGQAVSASLGLGSGITSIPVSIPFFAEATVAPSYLVTDRPVIAARGFGGALTSKDTVAFTFSSDSLGLPATTVVARAFRPAELALPELTAGTHTVRIEAVAGSGSTQQRDVLVRTFEVVGPRAVQARTTTAPLAGTTPVAGGAGFTTLILSDAGRGRVVPVLQELADGSRTRGDSAMAAGLARRVLADTFGIDDGGAAPEIDGFKSRGGYAVVPWGGGELELTASP